MDGGIILEWIKKYRMVLTVLVIGVVLMLLPAREEPLETAERAQEEIPGMEDRLEAILSRIDGAGEVAVMLTESTGEEIIYQSDGDGTDTVIITDAQRNQAGLIRTRQSPVYQGAIVVCGGADIATVRLAVVEAVSNVTGLGSDRITVLKME